MSSNAQAIAAIGLQAQQLNIEAIANNLANVSTPAFKSGRVNFQDLMSQGAAPLAMGVSGTLAVRDFSPGKLVLSSSPMDLAIDGRGFIEVELADGSVGFARGGALQINSEGVLATAAGLPLHPRIQIPSDYQELIIASDGKVKVRVAGAGGAREVGQIALAAFSNPAGLTPTGSGLYLPTDSSGPAIGGRAGEGGLGTVQQYRQEASNVNMINEMTDLMSAQRAFEMSSKAFTAADEMLAIVNNLRR